MNKRGSEDFTWKELVTMILVILVLAIVLMFIFTPYILDYLRNLPGYKYEGDKPEDVELVDEEEFMTAFRVAKILDGSKIQFCEKGDCNKLIDSNLYWDGSVNEAEIKVHQDDWFDFDETIGEASRHKITLLSDILAKRGDLYSEVKKDLPDSYYLVNLNGAAYYSGIIYRDKEVVVNG